MTPVGCLRSVAFRLPDGVGLHDRFSELDHAAHMLAVYASSRWSPMPPRKTRFPLCRSLGGGGLKDHRGFE